MKHWVDHAKEYDPRELTGAEWIELQEDLKRVLPVGRWTNLMDVLEPALAAGFIELGHVSIGNTEHKLNDTYYVRFPGWDGIDLPPVTEVVAATHAAERLAAPAQTPMSMTGEWLDKVAEDNGLQRELGEADVHFRVRIAARLTRGYGPK